MAGIGILLLAEDPLIGGVTSYVLSIVDAMRGDDRFRFHVAAFPAWEGEAALVTRGERLGLDVQIFSMSGTFDIRVLGRLRRYCKEHDIQVIHSQGYRSNVIASLSGVQAVLMNTCHGQLVGANKRLERWEKMGTWAMRRHQLTIACAEFVRRRLAEQEFDGSKIRVVHNCSPAPKSSQKKLREAMDAEGEHYVILYAGRLVAGKGLEILIDAVKEIPDTTLLFAGSGPFLDTLREKARLGRVDARFFGAVDDVTPYYEAADVVVLPSDMEAMPMTLIEAASFAKPVVATRVGGVAEIVRDGSTGMLIGRGDATALRGALEALRDKKVRREMGKAARAIWEQSFTPQVFAERLAPIYLEAAASAQ